MTLENITPQHLFFAHIRTILMYIRNKYPNVTAIMWDDMLRMTELPVLLGNYETSLFFGMSYITSSQEWLKGSPNLQQMFLMTLRPSVVTF